MSSPDDDSTLSDTIIDKLAPTTADGTPLVWSSDNEAHLDGLIFEVGKFYKRKGLFQTFFKHHAAVLSNGKLAVDAYASTLFTTDRIVDQHDFNNPCPPTTQRLVNYETARNTPGSPHHGGKPAPSLTKIPDECKDTTVLSQHAVDAEDSKLLTSLTHTFGKSLSSDELIDQADGSGYKFLELLRARAKNANTKDKALVAAQYARIIRDGVPHGTELKLQSLKDYIKEYKAIKRNVPERSRQTDEAEVDMIDLIAVKDPSVREIYELKRTASPPTSLDQASALLIAILRGRARCEEIDEVNAAAPTAGLGLAADNSGTLKALLAALGKSGVGSLNDKSLSALISTLQAVPDPNKTKAGDKDKKPPLDIPRDSDNKPIAWIEGMALCRCGVGGGKHLYKDCPKAKEKASKKAKKALAATVTDGVPPAGLTSSDALAAITALLSQIVVDGGAGVGTVVGTGVESKSDSAYFFPPPNRSLISVSGAVPAIGHTPPVTYSTDSARVLSQVLSQVRQCRFRPALRLRLAAPATSVLPYRGQWLPAGPLVGTTAARVLIASDKLTASELCSTGASSDLISSVIILGAVDSGCTGSLTPHLSALVNVRSCDEKFSSADGALTAATCIGDMPVTLRDQHGQPHAVVFRNVRCVPDFHYTLLSVTQLWEEQRIDAQFADRRSLCLPNGLRFPYLTNRRLPSLSMVSTARLAPKPAPTLVTTLRRSSPSLARLPPGLGLVASPLSASGSSASALSPGFTLPPIHKVDPPSAPSAPSGPSPPAAASVASNRALGFHRVGATSHVARLPAAQAAELLHRRSHLGVDKIRHAAHTTADAPKILASASATARTSSCSSCAAARIRRAAHTGTLSAPAPEPGVLHYDLKELVLSIGGYRYVVFCVDEFSRYVFVEFIRLKSDADAAIKRCIAAFNATVGTPIDEEGQPLPRPTVRTVHGDREGKLMSHAFRAFRSSELIHHTTSPPHDHDLNPIAERTIGLISETAAAIKDSTDAPTRLWPWLVAYAVEWHNSTVSSVGSSPADVNVSPHQRLTGRPPRVMDLASFGSRAVVLKPPSHQHKPSLSPRGWLGSFLGRSRYSKGGYDVLVGQKVVTSSSVLVDEEHFDWAPTAKRHQPLTAIAHAPASPQRPTVLARPLPAGAPTTRTLVDPIFGPVPLLTSSVRGGVPPPRDNGEVLSPPPSPPPRVDGGAPSPSPQSPPHSPSPRASPVAFPPLEDPPTGAQDGVPQRAARPRPLVDYFKKQPTKREWGPKWLDAVGADPRIPGPLATVPEETLSSAPSPPSPSAGALSPPPASSPVDYSPGGTHGFGSSYTPFVTADTPEPPPPLPPGAALRLEMTGTRAALHAHLYSHLDVMEASVAQTLLAAAADAPSPQAATLDLVPISPWSSLDGRRVPRKSVRLPGGGRALPVLVALGHDEDLRSPDVLANLASLGQALRADSPGAPSNHREAVEAGRIWLDAEAKELGNHARNASWTSIPRSEVPSDRRIHKLIWVYKLKRDGSAKARLCVQGNTLQSGVDFDQTWSSALRYSSARALFAYAARKGCRVRSVDLVAAYLQGRFVDGEVVYCYLPAGYPELDSNGQPLIARVEKPIYGIQQAGRRLQRMLFAWLVAQGFSALDDSDPCVFTRVHPNGEIITIGVYVDNLQIVHSAVLDANGRGPAGCAYNTFMDSLARDWDITDEGPMEDLLGIEVDYLTDGAIKLHQTSYVKKLIERFLPHGPLEKVQRGSLPYSSDFLKHIADALSLPPESYPELVRPMQERLGCLMYAATSTRCDIAFPVHYLCKCLQRPTPELIRETDIIFSYLARLPSAGLTYTREQMRLSGFSDASWETAASTSGWVVLWQSAALSWGSRKQKSIALSSCEAEIIALSEAAKDVVYLRKLVRGLGEPEPGPSKLATDSQSARDVSYNPEHHDRMKHVQRRHFFIRDMVESFEIEVPFVRTADNIADFFTKPMKSASQFHAFRKTIMNEP